jgi:hypothetical protein
MLKDKFRNLEKYHKLAPEFLAWLSDDSTVGMYQGRTRQ